MEKDDGLVEEVERRHELRGPTKGMSILLLSGSGGPVGGEVFETVEASRRSFFICVPDPERFRLGDTVEARIEHAGRTVICRLEIIRKEIDPRRGVALRVVTIDPTNEATLRELLGAIAY